LKSLSLKSCCFKLKVLKSFVVSDCLFFTGSFEMDSEPVLCTFAPDLFLLDLPLHKEAFVLKTLELV
jgi:hypothetical protein